MVPALTASSLPWKRLSAELGVIIAGVLIALGVDAWWETRQERNRAEEYLSQLLVDFRETEQRLQNAIAAENERVQQVDRVVARALDGSYPPADSLAFPTGFNQLSPLVGTLDALIRSGDLRLLRSDSLRFELVAFSALIEDTEAMLRQTESLIWTSTEGVAAGRARHSRTAARGWGQVDVAGALNDPEIISAMQIQATATRVRLFNLGRLERPTRRVIGLIEAELD